jgi:hypothetical protein
LPGGHGVQFDPVADLRAADGKIQIAAEALLGQSEQPFRLDVDWMSAP